MASKKYKNKKWLKEELIEKDRTLKDLSEQLDISIGSIRYWRDKFELKGDNKVELKCDNCEKSFKRVNRGNSENTFCSIDCQSEYKDQKIEKECENCGCVVKRVPSQATSEKYYCSKECRYEHQRGKNHPRYSMKEVECEYCGESFQRRPSQMAKYNNYCSEDCYYLEVKSDRDKNKNEYKKWRNAVRERDEWVCQNCSFSGERIEAHHIESWSQNPELRFDVENGISLCIECHYFYHKNNDDVHAAGLMEGRVDMERIEEMEKVGVFEEGIDGVN
jgi:hypothetical protein